MLAGYTLINEFLTNGNHNIALLYILTNSRHPCSLEANSRVSGGILNIELAAVKDHLAFDRWRVS